MSVVAKDSGNIRILHKTMPVSQEEKRMALQVIKDCGYVPILKGKRVTPPKKNRQIIAVNVRKMF